MWELKIYDMQIEIMLFQQILKHRIKKVFKINNAIFKKPTRIKIS